MQVTGTLLWRAARGLQVSEPPATRRGVVGLPHMRAWPQCCCTTVQGILLRRSSHVQATGRPRWQTPGAHGQTSQLASPAGNQASRRHAPSNRRPPLQLTESSKPPFAYPPFSACDLYLRESHSSSALEPPNTTLP